MVRILLHHLSQELSAANNSVTGKRALENGYASFDKDVSFLKVILAFTSYGYKSWIMCCTQSMNATPCTISLAYASSPSRVAVIVGRDGCMEITSRCAFYDFLRRVMNLEQSGFRSMACLQSRFTSPAASSLQHCRFETWCILSPATFSHDHMEARGLLSTRVEGMDGSCEVPCKPCNPEFFYAHRNTPKACIFSHAKVLVRGMIA